MSVNHASYMDSDKNAPGKKLDSVARFINASAAGAPTPI